MSLPPRVAVFLLAAVLGVLTGAAPLGAQDRYGALRGVVSDETGAVIPGIAITLSHLDSGRTLAASTGPYGDYFVPGIEPGVYAMRIELPGFEAAEFPDIEIRAGQTLELDARIRIGPVETTIDVAGLVGTVRPFGIAVVRNVPEDEFDRLPKGRSFDQLAITAAGVNPGLPGGGLQINGATGAENRFLIDRVVTSSLIDGGGRQDVPFEYLEQVQIATSGVAAEYPGALGGVVSASTKSGGNDFHGEAHIYYSGSGLSADPSPRLVLDPADDLTVGFVQDVPDSGRNLEGGFSLGGPIRRDTLFFYTAWSPQSVRRERAYLLDNGTSPGTFGQRQTRASGFGKLSWSPTPDIRSYLSMLWTPTRSTGTLAQFNGFGPNWDVRAASALAVNDDRGFFQPQSSLSSGLDIFLGPGIVLTARGQYFWDDYKDTGIPAASSVEYRTSSIGLAGVPPSLQQGVGFSNTPRVLDVAYDRTSRAGGNFDVAITGDMHGFHDFKAGYGIEKSINSVDASYPGGGFVFVFWDASFTGPSGVPDRGPYGYYEVHDLGTRGSAGARSQSVYAQDHWQAHPRLTLSFGLRLESERIPAFRDDDAGSSLDLAFGWDQKIAPRLGASWDPTGTGRARVYASYGRYFDWNKYGWVRDALGGSFWTVRYRSLDTPDVFSLSGTNTPGRDLWIPQIPNSYRDLAAVDFRAAVDPNLRPMSRDEWALGLDYQWDTRTVLGVRYLRSDLLRTIEDFARIVSGNAVFTYGNPGESLAKIDDFPSTATPTFAFPKPKRRYDALDVTLSRRFSAGWFGHLTYTWSRLYGNYAGLANGDEIRTPTLGFGFPASQQQSSSISRPGSNTTSAWDLDEILFDSHGNLDVVGPLPGDRPHVFRLAAGYEHPWTPRLGTSDVGVFVYAGSGTPLSTRVNTLLRLPVFVEGRGDMGRAPFLSYTDLDIGHEVVIAEGQSLRIELTLLNVFNQKVALHRFEHLNRGAGGSRDSSAIDLQTTDLFNGYDYDALIAASPDGANAYDPRYGMEDLFQEGLTGRLGIRWEF